MTSPTSLTRIDPADFQWEADSGVPEGVRRTTDAATKADGRSPLNEAALLSLRHHGLAGKTLWVAGSADEELSGFALVDEVEESPTREAVEVNLVVHPSSRNTGVGRVLADAVLEAYPRARVSAWSHGNHPAAAALASSLGFDRARDLWVMRRPLDEPLPDVVTPAKCVVRTFEPGRDEDAFLAVNAEAFADHPEQGAMTRADLDERMAEPWFDPEGFFVAERTDAVEGEYASVDSPSLLGFHWTKVHAGDPSFGEVYVVGISPAAQGTGLGKAVTLTGLHHLRSRGLGEVILYVEADNEAAVAMYSGLGFSHADEDTDVMYVRERPAAG